MREAVEHGAELLDEMYPGWDDHIDILTLDIVFATKCVLGQLYGGYFEGMRRLNLTTWDVLYYGFGSAEIEKANELTESWKDIIVERCTSRLLVS